ncbi:chorismate synthase [Vagococcus intermedius]|uniref:Chorismate synthase n=1 Tax=Vagococcus intermedius TaxID=2991418 RepID=A0AAF0CWJ2_9ENTE|nr:chorismate synthase [Vagococcus intermedius]WEG74157.1 chorismate synthase [Vagococcus intermedius]WEG76237.1 chorismate synthase [Vagococcus intermedius]
MRFLTAGESHGPELTAIIEGLPAGLPLSIDDIDKELARRQVGYGRGGRMLIEKDRVKITSGLRHGLTLGSPLTLVIENKDWKNWQSVMSQTEISEKEKKKRKVTRPRPGHADLVGGIKYGHQDLRNVLERSSARETAMRVAIGAVSKVLLQALDISVASHVLEIGGVRATLPKNLAMSQIKDQSEASDVRCLDAVAAIKMREIIDLAKKEGNTVGGVVEVVVGDVPVGLGSYTHWDQKLDGKIAKAMMSINAFKGVEFGVGFDAARLPGSEVMDEITWSDLVGYRRESNHLGGFEGGMTNGMPVVVRGVMKPIPTLYKPLASVDIETKETYKASVERSDSCAVPAASVIAEAVVATEIANALLNKFDSDSFGRLKKELSEYREYTRQF